MIGRLLGGRYQLLQLVGHGGMARVYEARDWALDRNVAVKVLLPQFGADLEFQERFRREARTAASLRHPHIVTVFDEGTYDDGPYIVMEFVEGETLKDLARRGGPLPLARLIAIGLELCNAIGHAHASGVVHRDIKPQNVLMGPGGQVKVADFGIALAPGLPSITQTGVMLTSVQYTAPEKLRGQASTPASDLYSLGVVLYELATGQLPFDAESPVAVAMKHVNEAPRLPSRLNAAVPPGLEALILRALAKDPADRFRSAQEMAEAIARCERRAEERTLAWPVASGRPTGRAQETNSAPRVANPNSPGSRPASASRGRRRFVGPWAAPLLAALASVALLATLALAGVFPTAPAADAPAPAEEATAATPSPPAPDPSPTAAPNRTSTPASLVALPSVLGLPRKNAETLLRAQGFNVREEKRSAAAPEDTIIAQEPAAGTSLLPGAEVTLVVSSGRPPRGRGRR